MDPVMTLVQWLDPFLVAPYRYLSNPVWGVWLGTAFLAFWCVLAGDITMGIAYRLNWRFMRAGTEEMVRNHNRSMAALKAGEKELYKGFNKMANEAFGKAFFQNLAVGMGSLWPLFFAAAWLDKRFDKIGFPLPGTKTTVPWALSFVVLYIVERILFSKYLKPRLPFFRRSLELAKSMSPTEKMNLLKKPDEVGK